MAQWSAASEEVGAAIVPAHDKVEGSGYTAELVLGGILLGRCPGKRFEVLVALKNEFALHHYFRDFVVLFTLIIIIIIFYAKRTVRC